MAKGKYDNPHAAGIYRAIALRFYSRYVEARSSAYFRGGDIPDHGDLPTQIEVDEKYVAAVEHSIFETPASAESTLALVHFAGVLAADRLVGEVTEHPVNDERDAYHQAVALAAATSWLNKESIAEMIEQEREARS